MLKDVFDIDLHRYAVVNPTTIPGITSDLPARLGDFVCVKELSLMIASDKI